MTGKNIGLNRRRAIRAANRELRREGIKAKIETPERTRSRALALTNYIRDVDPALLRKLDLDQEETHHALTYIADVAATTNELREVEHGEKVDVIGFRHFTSDDFARCQREMMATMMRSPGIDPLEHFVLSWQAHEQPTPDQIHRAAEIFLDVMGLGENQAIYAAHSNTANYHLHIAANRVHPQSLQRIAAGGDWQVDTIHQAIAMIEHEQGWATEPKAIYRANEHGVFHNATDIQVRDGGGPTGRYPSKQQRAEERERTVAEQENLPVEQQLSEGALAYEGRTKLTSFERLAKTVIMPIMKSARSWSELHERLAAQGFEYEIGGSGARVRWGEKTLAASVAHRSGALRQMEARAGFGDFEERDPSVLLAERNPALLSNAADLGPYWTQRAAYDAEVAAHHADLRGQQEVAKQQLLAINDCIVADLDAVGWAGAGTILNVARGVAGHEYRRVMADVMAQFDGALRMLSNIAAFPSPAAWASGALPPSLPSPGNPGAPALLSSFNFGDPPLQFDAEGYRRIAVGRTFHHVDQQGQTVARDLGDLVTIDQPSDVEAVRLALVLAQQKWDSVTIVSGDRRFRQLCERIATEEGIRLVDAEGRALTEHVQTADLDPHTSSSPVQLAANPAQQAEWTQPVDPVEQRAVDPVHGDFPILCEGSDDRADGVALFVGLDPTIDAWLEAHRRDPQDLVRLRPLASRVMQNERARLIRNEMEAEGLVEAQRISQQATFHLRQLNQARQAGMQR